MALLKEDGSLDVERIRQLPFEERMREIRGLTRAQVKEYYTQMPITESNGSIVPVKVDYKMEDLLAHGWCTSEDIHKILTK